jgi:hypothetical protein
MRLRQARARLGWIGVAATLVASPAAAQQSATSSALGWDAADTSSYDYAFSVIYDSNAAVYRAYWVQTVGGLSSEHVVQATSSVPWGFSSTTVALETSGVRVQRFVGVFGGRLDHQAAVNQTGASIAGYSTEFTLGYLRRTSGGDATLPVYECTWSATQHFTSNSSAECTGAGATAVLLGYASSTARTGYAVRYRCVNPSYPNNHFDSASATCEGSGYTNEGGIGYWRLGLDPGASCSPAATTPGEVSPYADGAYVAPGRVIKDGSTWYMTYTASPHYYAGGPFNQIFIATSSNGASWTPSTDSHGDPIPLRSYRSGYVCEVLGRANATEETNAFGVGVDNIIKVGSTYHHFYLDSSASSTGTLFWWKHATTTSPTAAITSDAFVTDENGTALTSSDRATSAPVVVYDENPNDSRFWLYSNNVARDNAYWYPASSTSTATAFLVAGYSTRTLAKRSGYPYITVSGATTSLLGTVSSQYGWYVYTPHSTSCAGNDCGISSVGITKFCPAASIGSGGC